MNVFFLVCFFLVFLVVSTYALGGWLAAPWLPLWKKDVYRMLDLAKIKENELVCDLGAGDGRLLIAAVKDYKAKGLGFEIAILPYLIGCFKIYIKGLNGRINFKLSNFFGQNIAQADVICLFLTPAGMEKLKTKLEKETKKGVRILSYAFEIKGWTPTLVDKPEQNRGTIYLYQR